MTLKFGTTERRTKRRSAETTAATDIETPEGTRVISGVNPTANTPTVGVTLVTNGRCVMLATKARCPLNSVTLGANMTFVRVSPWAARMKKNVSMSLKIASPIVMPASGLKFPNCGMPMSNEPWRNGTLRSCENVVGESMPTTVPWLGHFLTLTRFSGNGNALNGGFPPVVLLVDVLVLVAVPDVLDVLVLDVLRCAGCAGRAGSRRARSVLVVPR